MKNIDTKSVEKLIYCQTALTNTTVVISNVSNFIYNQCFYSVRRPVSILIDMSFWHVYRQLRLMIDDIKK